MIDLQELRRLAENRINTRREYLQNQNYDSRLIYRDKAEHAYYLYQQAIEPSEKIIELIDQIGRASCRERV